MDNNEFERMKQLDKKAARFEYLYSAALAAGPILWLILMLRFSSRFAASRPKSLLILAACIFPCLLFRKLSDRYTKEYRNLRKKILDTEAVLRAQGAEAVFREDAGLTVDDLFRVGFPDNWLTVSGKNMISGKYRGSEFSSSDAKISWWPSDTSHPMIYIGRITFLPEIFRYRGKMLLVSKESPWREAISDYLLSDPERSSFREQLPDNSGDRSWVRQWDIYTNDSGSAEKALQQLPDEKPIILSSGDPVDFLCCGDTGIAFGSRNAIQFSEETRELFREKFRKDIQTVFAGLGQIMDQFSTGAGNNEPNDGAGVDIHEMLESLGFKKQAESFRERTAK